MLALNTSCALLKVNAVCRGINDCTLIHSYFIKLHRRLQTESNTLIQSLTINSITSPANMKTFAIASVIALATVASAQLDKIPSCAVRLFEPFAVFPPLRPD